jgi:hypothetical protein
LTPSQTAVSGIALDTSNEFSRAGTADFDKHYEKARESRAFSLAAG